jgi:hypothetical protein
VETAGFCPLVEVPVSIAAGAILNRTLGKSLVYIYSIYLKNKTKKLLVQP